MAGFQFQCPRCRNAMAAAASILACSSCGGPLVVEYERTTNSDWRSVRAEPEMPLPLMRPGDLVTLGEGDTPVVRLPAVQRALGLDTVWGKLELVNPTGSFKDRGAAVMLSALVENGVGELVEDSSGNAGAAVAAYAAPLQHSRARVRSGERSSSKAATDRGLRRTDPSDRRHARRGDRGRHRVLREKRPSVRLP